jgi:hypothetical protein
LRALGRVAQADRRRRANGRCREVLGGVGRGVDRLVRRYTPLWRMFFPTRSARMSTAVASQEALDTGEKVGKRW